MIIFEVTATVWGQKQFDIILRALINRDSAATTNLGIYTESTSHENIKDVRITLTPKDQNSKITDANIGEILRLLVLNGGSFIEKFSFIIVEQPPKED